MKKSYYLAMVEPTVPAKEHPIRIDKKGFFETGIPIVCLAKNFMLVR